MDLRYSKEAENPTKKLMPLNSTMALENTEKKVGATPTLILKASEELQVKHWLKSKNNLRRTARKQTAKVELAREPVQYREFLLLL